MVGDFSLLILMRGRCSLAVTLGSPSTKASMSKSISVDSDFVLDLTKPKPALVEGSFGHQDIFSRAVLSNRATFVIVT